MNKDWNCKKKKKKSLHIPGAFGEKQKTRNVH